MASEHLPADSLKDIGVDPDMNNTIIFEVFIYAPTI